ncbi:phosphatase PAP2 family protein [Actinoplanes rectilineatus]|uniref:phosphatase PAP2 family protein n=1 Tax=Actinoplanes rectilineatus TaxID=113571 RepID=UPI0005F29DF4|nr:phosphatase PAP2 family protein [Actinoplanes rectilineatus]
MALSRRSLLKVSAGSAGLIAIGGAPAAASAATTSTTATAFVDAYRTNTTANLTVDTNAAVRILSGMQQVWTTGTAWNTGTALDRAFLRANVRYCVQTTTHRTAAQADRAFVVDRQHQSYSVIAGLGPLADVYKAGALAVTGITSAPSTTPATTVSDAVPADAPAGSALGAGSATSELGKVVTLVNTLRGNWSSGNPSKFSFQYPRPWRMTADSRVVDTGTVDAFGYPVYDADTVVVPTLLRQRSNTPAEDGGYVSGHTNALFLASLAFAYAVPERFQEMVAAAYDLAETRIIAGMHSPADVIGGRILGTALAAAILGDADNATLKAEARAQAAAYFQAKVGGDVFAFAHSQSRALDGYADRTVNAASVRAKQTYGLPGRRSTAKVSVPKGAEVLLETRLPYLDAAQRREVLRTTGLAAGNPLLDGPEQWGRLDLFTAADGYGTFDATVAVTMDGAAGGFHAADSWRNDIDGRGGLVKLGTGTLTLSGDNTYRGGTTVAAGTLVADGRHALGDGDVTVTGGTLRLASAAVRVGGRFRQTSGRLSLGVRAESAAALTVDEEATLGAGATVELTVEPSKRGYRAAVPLLKARRIKGGLPRVAVTTPGYRASLFLSGGTLYARIAG